MPLEQLDIYSALNDRPVARRSDPCTSWAAARKNLPRKGPQALIVYETLGRYGDGGLTDDELATITGLHPGSASKRRGELVAAGLVEPTGEMRTTRHHCKAIVWKVAS